MLVIPQYIVQVDPSFVFAPHKGYKKIPNIVDLFFHYLNRCAVEILIESRKINVGREQRLHREHVVKQVLGILVGGVFYFAAGKRVLQI